MKSPPTHHPPAARETKEKTRRHAITAREPWNILILATQMICLRIAWIFKTESVIIPAFVDTIAGAGWVRGCLPVLNRFGQSLPPLFFAEHLRRTRMKKWPLLVTTLLMSAPFLTISAIWLACQGEPPSWLPAAFLLLYAIFFCTTGLNLLSSATIQGKLIRPHRRGRLLAVSGVGGSVASILCAWFLLPYWLSLPDGGFGYIFLFTGLGFVAASLIVLAIREPSDNAQAPVETPLWERIRHAWSVFRHDGNFRQAAIVAMLFISIQYLFPHFQALGRERLETGSFDLMLWVVVQNAGVGIFSLISGAIADRIGNRLAARLQIFLIGTTPLLALGAVHIPAWGGQTTFRIMFFLLGLTPVTMRTFVNYTLELAEETDHPRYVSMMSLCMALPFALSPLVGLLVDWLGFEIVFLSIAGLIFLGGMLTFRMAEPRHQTHR